MIDDRSAAAIALTSRLVDSDVKPMSPREYWDLAQRVAPSRLLGRRATDIASEFDLASKDAERLAALLNRGTGLAIALERLDHSGIWTIVEGDECYPVRLRERLGSAAPVVIHGVGDKSILHSDGVGIVGSRNVSPRGTEVARTVSRNAVLAGFHVVSGAARGVDSDAMNEAVATRDGRVLGVLADSLKKAIDKPAMRKGIADGRICLLTPYSPASGFSVGSAMGRNKIIYALSRCTIIVSTDNGTGGTWAGATEALKHQYGRVASWIGPGGGEGNRALLSLGALQLDDATDLSPLLEAAPDPKHAPQGNADLGGQLSLGF